MDNAEKSQLSPEAEQKGSKLSYKDDIDAGPRRENIDREGYDFTDFWNELPRAMTDEERLEAFVEKHQYAAIPDFSALYQIDLPPELNTALTINFIKLNYIVGGKCQIPKFDNHTGQPTTAEVQLEYFRQHFPQLVIPENLSPADAVEFIDRNYATSTDFAIARVAFVIEDEKILEALSADAIASPTSIIMPRGEDIDRETRVRSSIKKRHNKPEPIPYERSIQAWERNLLSMSDIATNELLLDYGLATTRMIPPERLHVATRHDEEYVGGTYRGYNNDIVVVQSYSETEFAIKAVHEMIHFKSRKFYRQSQEDGTWFISSVGMEIFPAPLTAGMLEYLNESVTEELAVRSIRRSFPERGDYYTNIAEDLTPVNEQATLQSETHLIHGYYNACRALGRLLDKIQYLNQERFTDGEQVFDVFARASLTGRKLELGILIERTFGKGSFRRLGNAGSEDSFVEVCRALGAERLETRLQELTSQAIELSDTGSTEEKTAVEDESLHVKKLLGEIENLLPKPESKPPS